MEGFPLYTLLYKYSVKFIILKRGPLYKGDFVNFLWLGRAGPYFHTERKRVNICKGWADFFET